MTQARSNTVDGVLRRSARRVPGRTAVRYADRAWTYRALDDAVTAAARVLRADGLRPGDRVASYGHNSDAYLIGFLACARAGLVHVPVNHSLTGEDLRYLLEQSGSALVLTDAALAHRLPDSVRTMPCTGRPTGCWSGSRSTTRRMPPGRTLTRRTPPGRRPKCLTTPSSSCCTPRAPPPCPRAR